MRQSLDVSSNEALNSADLGSSSNDSNEALAARIDLELFAGL